MLSERSTPVIRATLPAVEPVIGDIAELFYTRLFEDHPELLRDLFNRASQANGEQRRALAGSVISFARLLVERPDARPDAMLRRIAHRHASLGVTSDQYPLVQRHLLGAIGEVLGDAVTPEVAAAWDEVYWLMAGALIAVESRLYQGAGVLDGEIWRRMTVDARTEETPDVVSLVLRPADPEGRVVFRPGQYVSVRTELPDGARQIRQYSISGGPDERRMRISVKRVRGGDGPEGEVSSRLHAHVRPGDVLDVSLPFGDLVLPEGDGPLLLASAGIGNTPMLSMLHHLAAEQPERPVVVVHADRAPADHVHLDELRRLVDTLPAASLHLWYEEPDPSVPGAARGRADITKVNLPPRTTAYLCGPLPFMRAVRGDLLGLGLPAREIHYEVFGSDLWLGRD